MASTARNGAGFFCTYSLLHSHEILSLFDGETEAQGGYFPKSMQLVSSRAGILI